MARGAPLTPVAFSEDGRGLPVTGPILNLSGHGEKDASVCGRNEKNAIIASFKRNAKVHLVRSSLSSFMVLLFFSTQ
ncbi:MAG: hypothetical protein ACE5L7_10440, partial [Candidatus Aminicenantales bacterium]